MKRPIIVLVLIVGIIAVSAYSRSRVYQARETLHAYAQTIFTYIEKEDAAGAQTAVEELATYWQKEQRLLILFLRHAELDELSRSVARLGSFAAFEEYADLDAELRAILWQIDHIWHSERLRVGTAFLRAFD